jgi:uncharacterized membrane protein HdeD (DUF308 family)
MLATTLSRHWWMTLIRGLIWIVFGIVIFTQPLISLVTLTLTFGAFVLADGVGKMVTAIRGRQGNEDWWVLLLAGLCGIGAGVMTFFIPGLTALAVLFYIATWAIATGLLETVAAIRLRKEIEGEFWRSLWARLDRIRRVAYGTPGLRSALGPLVDRGLCDCAWRDPHLLGV